MATLQPLEATVANLYTCIPADLPPVWAVALVRKISKNVFLGNLGGRRSCQGHMFSPAGWLLPAKHPLSHEHNSSTTCNPNQGTCFKEESRCKAFHSSPVVQGQLVLLVGKRVRKF